MLNGFSKEDTQIVFVDVTPVSYNLCLLIFPLHSFLEVAQKISETEDVGGLFFLRDSGCVTDRKGRVKISRSWRMKSVWHQRERETLKGHIVFTPCLGEEEEDKQG